MFGCIIYCKESINGECKCCLPLQKSAKYQKGKNLNTYVHNDIPVISAQTYGLSNLSILFFE